MDRYVRVDQQKKETSTSAENEVRIMAAGKMRSYITYASVLMTEKGHETVVVKAMGKAINKAVTVAEIIKRRISGLHQNTEIGSVDFTDVWEPIEEGLSRLETTRHVSVIVITLSKKPLDGKSTGYQPPLSEDLVKPFQSSFSLEDARESGIGNEIIVGNSVIKPAAGTKGNHRGRRGRATMVFGCRNEGAGDSQAEREAPEARESRGRVRGRGRGRGRSGGRGRERDPLPKSGPSQGGQMGSAPQ